MNNTNWNYAVGNISYKKNAASSSVISKFNRIVFFLSCFIKQFVSCCQEFLIYECLLPNGAIDICLHVNYDKTQFSICFFDVLFRFMQPILLDATAWVHMSEQFCVYFVALKVLFYFYFIVQAFRWSKEIKIQRMK